MQKPGFFMNDFISAGCPLYTPAGLFSNTCSSFLSSTASLYLIPTLSVLLYCALQKSQINLFQVAFTHSLMTAKSQVGLKDPLPLSSHCLPLLQEAAGKGFFKKRQHHSCDIVTSMENQEVMACHSRNHRKKLWFYHRVSSNSKSYTLTVPGFPQK